MKKKLNIIIVATIVLAFIGLLLVLLWNRPRIVALRSGLSQERKASASSVVTPYFRPYHGKILAADTTVLARDADYYDLFIDCRPLDSASFTTKKINDVLSNYLLIIKLDYESKISVN